MDKDRKKAKENNEEKEEEDGRKSLNQQKNEHPKSFQRY